MGRSSPKARPSLICTALEEEARSGGFHLVAGVDEVGRGALAGPVVAAAVILDPRAPLPHKLNDSKLLAAAERERIAAELARTSIAIGLGAVEADEIDRLDILRATQRAMSMAIERLDPKPDFLLIDGHLGLRDVPLPQRAIVRGDAFSASIAAASVIAKTWRDRLMRDYDALYPQYGFAQHVGYGTRAHLAALRAYGPCPLHRRSFRGVCAKSA
ncbi:ribonuclease HII [Pyrinomonas sp.]|uniref:ribonuclease HII n=1 Tax=Pyrinomonas sp. TaxID=2080306 RepID=UPI0033249BD0